MSPDPKTPPKTPPRNPNDPWANFPGGNPFGPNGPFGPGGPFAGSPFGDPAAMENWFRGMGLDSAEFRRMMDEMQRNLAEAFKGIGTDPSKSFVSGFNVRVGPDGKPHFSSFGTKPTVKANPEGGLPAVATDEREPLTDVIDEGARIAVTIEMPGVARDDIDLHMTESELEISVDTDRRKYHKVVKLPARVDPDTTKATYTNGVLDVTVAKLKGPQGKRVVVK